MELTQLKPAEDANLLEAVQFPLASQGSVSCRRDGRNPFSHFAPTDASSVEMHRLGQTRTYDSTHTHPRLHSNVSLLNKHGTLTFAAKRSVTKHLWWLQDCFPPGVTPCHRHNGASVSLDGAGAVPAFPHVQVPGSRAGQNHFAALVTQADAAQHGLTGTFAPEDTLKQSTMTWCIAIHPIKAYRERSQREGLA